MLTSQQQTEASHGLQTAYTTAGGASAIPWDQLIPIVISLIQGCLQPKSAAELKAAADNLQLQPAVRMACIELGGLGWYRRNNGPAIAAAIKNYLPTASDDLLVAVLD